MPRSVDTAMAEDRPEKQFIRRRWLDIVDEQRNHHRGSTPLYLTMCGAEGREVEMLIERGILRTTDTGAISDADAARIVAVESSKNAMAELKKRFPGISAVGMPVQDLLRGWDLVSMPQGDNHRRCRARIVNLDFNGNLDATTLNGSPVWQQLKLVVKLAMLRCKEPETWFLFLTFNATIHWAEEIQRAAVGFLKENMNHIDSFAADCNRVLGGSLLRLLVDSEVPPAQLCRQGRQRFLMAFVPKRIAFDVRSLRWSVETVENLHYGNDETCSAMVTWIFKFHWDERIGIRPYEESVARSLTHCAELTSTGDRVAIS